jgi:hypothetical protein
MNSSAKLTAVTLLAAGALGVAAMQGCTVTSGTNSDTDGGSSSGTSGTSGNGTSSGSDSGTGDSGSATCEGNKQEIPFEPASCQSCMNGACCDKMKTCFDIVKPDTEFDCNKLYKCAFVECIQAGGGDAAIARCQEDCASTPPPNGNVSAEVLDAFNAIVACGAACSSHGCNFQ